jgi:DNA-binding transcriptional MerR regulator
MHFDRERVVQRMRKWEAYLNEHALPTWDNLPGLELYMDQVVSLLNGYLGFLPKEVGMDAVVTAAAVNNYVRKKIIPPPVKKKYSKIHLAYLLMICSLKNSVSISYIQQVIPLSLSEQEVHDIYNNFVAQHRRTTLYFVEQVNRQASQLLAAGATNDEAVSNIATAFAVVSGLSRMATEKLILMQKPEQTSVE